MTFDEYCEIIDKSNFMVDSSNPYDMKILKASRRCVGENLQMLIHMVLWMVYYSEIVPYVKQL